MTVIVSSVESPELTPIVTLPLNVVVPETSKLPELVTFAALIFAFVNDKSPVEAPVPVVVANATSSEDSSYPKNIFASLPLSIIIPESPDAEPVRPFPNSNS